MLNWLKNLFSKRNESPEFELQKEKFSVSVIRKHHRKPLKDGKIVVKDENKIHLNEKGCEVIEFFDYENAVFVLSTETEKFEFAGTCFRMEIFDKDNNLLIEKNIYFAKKQKNVKFERNGIIVQIKRI